MTCAHCNDTGSLSKDALGYMDCVHCDVAEERVALEAWAGGEGYFSTRSALWAIYQRGKAAAIPA